jgi:Caspase domain/SIR2-like domain
MTKDDKAARRKALVVGISDYANLQKLDFCKNDGREVYEVLSSLGYEISDENRLVGEAKGERVRDAIYDFFDDKRNNFDDTLLFYYSGHGVPGLNLPIYITSNYDHFMEAALKSRGKRPISDFCRWNEDLAGYAKADNINSKIYRHDYKPTPDNPLVYHLHGDIDYPHSIVLTERDYYDFVFNLNYNSIRFHYRLLFVKHSGI